MKNTKKLVISSLLMALGLVLPFLTGQIRSLGNALLPMHLPVIICGFLCGWEYGLVIGFITPILRSLLFAMPPLPLATAMAFELAAYGLLTGLLYRKLGSTPLRTYASLILSMIGGRLVWGLASMLIYHLQGNVFTWNIFFAGAFANAIPGIIVQIIVVPILILSLKKAGIE